jgi:hypothetical protein
MKKAKKTNSSSFSTPKSAKLTLIIIAVGTGLIMTGLITNMFKQNTAPESSSAASLTCFGQCKSDPAGQAYPDGKTCVGNDNLCYRCQSGKFNVIPLANCELPVTGSTCTGQCKGDKANTKYSNGYTCYGTNGTTCYKCQNSKFNTISKVACDNKISTNSCTGQCKGDAAGSKYMNGYSCTGMDGKCYRCDNGKFKTYANSICSNLTPYCKGQCKGDSASSTYPNGFKCYGNDSKCYQCSSGTMKTITLTSCK